MSKNDNFAANNDNNNANNFMHIVYNKLPLKDKFVLAQWNEQKQSQYIDIDTKYRLSKIANNTAKLCGIVGTGITISNMIDGDVVNSIIAATMVLVYGTASAISNEIHNRFVEPKAQLDAKLEADSIGRAMSTKDNDMDR